MLRKEWGFEGYVMSDWGAVSNRVKGVAAGLDLEMPASGGINDRKIVEAVKKGELDEIIAETRNEEEVMREKAKKIENSMTDKNLMSMFTRIHRKAHNGLAIVPIERESCSGCFNKVTPQRQIDVKRRKKIITCEYCGRILIDEELANQNEMRRRKKGLLASL